MPAVGFEITFDDDRTSFRRANVADCSELAAKLPLRERIRQAVRHKPLTLAVLAEDLGAPVDSIDKTVRRHMKPGPRQLFTRVTDVEGIQRIALVERRSA
jgi:hypothetical protein